MRTVVIFGDFIPFALSWQWTQRPAGDSMKDMKELLNHSFKTCCQCFLFFSGLISIKGWKLKRLLTYESTWKSSYTGTVKNEIKYSRATFFRKGKCLGSSCSDHPASLHEWVPWYHRETRMFQLCSFVRKERNAETENWEKKFFWLSYLLISEKIFWLWCVILLLLSAYLKWQLFSNTASSHTKERIKSKYPQGMKVLWLSNGQ